MTSYLIAVEDLQGRILGRCLSAAHFPAGAGARLPADGGQQFEDNFIRDGKLQSHAFKTVGKLVIA